MGSHEALAQENTWCSTQEVSDVCLPFWTRQKRVSQSNYQMSICIYLPSSSLLFKYLANRYVHSLFWCFGTVISNHCPICQSSNYHSDPTRLNYQIQILYGKVKIVGHKFRAWNITLRMRMSMSHKLSNLCCYLSNLLEVITVGQFVCYKRNGWI
jgi:hypothetical protein